MFDNALANEAYGMENAEGEYFDGAEVDGLMRYVNHSFENRNSEFVSDRDKSPYIQLVLTRDVRKDEEILADYGKGYPYRGGRGIASKFHRKVGDLSTESSDESSDDEPPFKMFKLRKGESKNPTFV